MKIRQLITVHKSLISTSYHNYIPNYLKTIVPKEFNYNSLTHILYTKVISRPHVGLLQNYGLVRAPSPGMLPVPEKGVLRRDEQCPLENASYKGYSPPKCTCNAFFTIIEAHSNRTWQLYLEYYMPCHE